MNKEAKDQKSAQYKLTVRVHSGFQSRVSGPIATPASEAG